MKKLFYLLFMGAAVTAFAQTAKKPLTLANGMIANSVAFKTSSVLSKKVFNDASALPQEIKAMDISMEGSGSIVNLKIKDLDFFYDKISLAELNQQFQINENTPVYVDGVKITNVETLILGDALGNMEAKLVDGKKTLFVTSFDAK